MKYSIEKINQLTWLEILKTTTNDSVYRKCLKNLYANCSRCRWNRRCNRWYKIPKTSSWKEQRKTQYKQNNNDLNKI
mgnify:CR=1 FL=1